MREELLDGYSELPINSSAELRNFQKSSIWKDILKELDIWKSRAREVLEDYRAPFEELRINQGRIDAIVHLETILESMIAARAAYEEGVRDERGHEEPES